MRFSTDPCRGLFGRRRILLVALLGLGGCTSSLPRRAADRPLTLPAGENRGALGQGIFVRDGLAQLTFDGVGYARGLTDRLELRLPFILRYRSEGDGAQWGIEGGIGGLGLLISASGERVSVDSDPRQLPRTRRPDITVWPFLGLVARVPLAEALTLEGGLNGSFQTGFAEIRQWGLGAQARLVWSPFEVFSMALGAGAVGYADGSVEVTLRSSAGAFGALWWHTHPTLDVVLRPGLVYEATGFASSLTLGVDWHFQ